MIGRSKSHKGLALILRVVFLFVAIAVIIWAIHFLFRIESINIQGITISGNESVESEDIKRVVEENLNGSRYLVIPKTNIWLYPKKKMDEKLKEEFHKISKTEIKVSNGVLNVYIEEREPHALWCKDQEECYFLDITGFIFTPAPMFSDNVFFVYRGEGNLGEYYLNPNEFQDIEQFIEALSLLDFFPESLNFDTENTFVISTASGVKILMEKQNSYSQVFANLETVLEEEDLIQSRSIDYENLDYINLRFDTKVFYKFKTEDVAETE